MLTLVTASAMSNCACPAPGAHFQRVTHTQRRKLNMPLLLLVVICTLAWPAQAEYGSGSGTPEDPYLIYTAEQMNTIGAEPDDWDKHFKLMADIDLSAYTGTEFNIIGYWRDWDDNKPFTGVFDGNGHAISNFSYSYAGENSVGLFGCVFLEEAMIKNLGLIGPDVNAPTADRIGALVGTLEAGFVINCYVEGGSVIGSERVGGLTGYNEGFIGDCYSAGRITGKHQVGGLAGYNRGMVRDCYSTGSVTAEDHAGGLVGHDHGIVSDCYSMSSVTGDNYVGGLVGYGEGPVTNCYSTGSVAGAGNAVGGLVGFDDHGWVFNSFWDTETSGLDSSDGGSGKTTAEMQQASTFVGWGVFDDEWILSVYEDYQSGWTINEGSDYPRLVWQELPGVSLGASESSYGGGSGTEDDPYLIYTAEQLNTIGLFPSHWDKHFRLMADLDLSSYQGQDFNIIGRPRIESFEGTFDGNGHTISNFTYTSTGEDYIALFSRVGGRDAEIKHLGLIDPTIRGGTAAYVGALVAFLRSGTVTDCYVEGGSMLGGRECAGGLVGYNDDGTILNCYTRCSISGTGWAVGGLVGNNKDASQIANCYSTSTVLGESDVGGLVGRNEARISNCYSRSGVLGTGSGVGGLVGDNEDGEVAYCYSAGPVSAGHNVGGLIGRGGQTLFSYWDVETSWQTTSAGGQGKTTAEMKTKSTFAAWADERVWTIHEGVDYPRLIWENAVGEPISGRLSEHLMGTGAPGDPYLIFTAEELNLVGQFPGDWDKCFELMADIDLSNFTGATFNVIGNEYYPFAGEFEGGGFTIANLTYASGSTDSVGLFGYMSTGAIRNLGLIDPSIDAPSAICVGSLAGYISRVTVTNCYVLSADVVGGENVGILVGQNQQGSITSNCWTTGEISANERLGGLVGHNAGTITDCFSMAYATGGATVGGLAGANSTEGSITNSIAWGEHAGSKSVGGLVGHNDGAISGCASVANAKGGYTVGGLVGSNSGSGCIANSYAVGQVGGRRMLGGLVGANEGTVVYCYSAGPVASASAAGGLIGSNQGSVSSCFWDTQMSNRPYSAGGIGKTTAEMQSAAVYAGWGCDSAWTISEGRDYPKLAWQNAPGQMITTPSLASIAGTGTEADPYLIYTAEQFSMVGQSPCEWDKHFRLMADIDLGSHSGPALTFIGNQHYPFTGEFDGNFCSIANFAYATEASGPVGLFAYVKSGVLRNLGLIEPTIDAPSATSVGSLVGRLSAGDVVNCYVESADVAGDESVGILVGHNHQGRISDYCWTTGRVSANVRAGGLVGYNEGTVADCISVADAVGGSTIGGLVGSNSGAASISDSHAVGTVLGDSSVGGLAAHNEGEIARCASWTQTEGGDDAGGLVGYNSHYAGVTDSYSTGRVAGGSSVGGFVGHNYGGITGCASMAQADGEDSVGGLAGSNWGTIANSYTTASTSGQADLGGLTGHNYGTIANCYAAGFVSQSQLSGGLVGTNDGKVRDSFWDVETSGQTTSSGGVGKTTAQMQSADTYSVWGCDSVWTIDEGKDYPRLAWENEPGEIITAPPLSSIPGTGSPTDPYLIHTAEQLNTIGLFPCVWSKHFTLVADIDLAGFKKSAFNVIGHYENRYDKRPFTGVFDGNGHAILNFTYGSSHTYYTGLFRYMDAPDAEIKNLALIDPNVDAGTGDHVGALVGRLRGGTIASCHVSSGSVSGGEHIGGLVGKSDGKVADCSATADVSGNREVGGLVGNSDGTISRSYASGSVLGAWSAGGLVGENHGMIAGSSAAGDVSGGQGIGGLVGHNYGAIEDSHAGGNVVGIGNHVGGLVGFNYTDGHVIGTCATGSVVGDRYAGGLIGNNSGTVAESYSVGTVSASAVAGGLVGRNCCLLASIANCYATGEVQAGSTAGGLAGSNGGTVANSYSVGSVGASYNAGGLIGGISAQGVIDCFWDIQTSRQTVSGGGTGRTTSQMYTSSTFLDAGWDFVGESTNGTEDIWVVSEGQDYPKLTWQSTAGALNP